MDYIVWKEKYRLTGIDECMWSNEKNVQQNLFIFSLNNFSIGIFINLIEIDFSYMKEITVIRSHAHSNSTKIYKADCTNYEANTIEADMQKPSQAKPIRANLSQLIYFNLIINRTYFLRTPLEFTQWVHKLCSHSC